MKHHYYGKLYEMFSSGDVGKIKFQDIKLEPVDWSKYEIKGYWIISKKTQTYEMA